MQIAHHCLLSVLFITSAKTRVQLISVWLLFWRSQKKKCHTVSLRYSFGLSNCGDYRRAIGFNLVWLKIRFRLAVWMQRSSGFIANKEFTRSCLDLVIKKTSLCIQAAFAPVHNRLQQRWKEWVAALLGIFSNYLFILNGVSPACTQRKLNIVVFFCVNVTLKWNLPVNFAEV